MVEKKKGHKIGWVEEIWKKLGRWVNMTRTHYTKFSTS